MITLVRHGEAAASWGEHPNPGLSDLGQQQAEAVAQTLSQEPVEAILTSPMQRCQETAIPLSLMLNLTPTVTPEVSEIPTPQDLTTDRVTWLKELMAGTWSQTPPLILDWRQALLDKVNSLPENTVVFTHFVAINAVVSALEASDQAVVFRPTYCSLTRLERDSNGALNVKRRGDEAATRIL
ncbi:MAG: histidine phosphatase family protein [Pseudomonadota bacterium]